MNNAAPLSDTSSEALAVQLACLRRLSPQERLAKTFAWSCEIRQMALAAIRRRYPDLDESEVRLRFLEQAYGRELADSVREWLHHAEREIVD